MSNYKWIFALNQSLMFGIEIDENNFLLPFKSSSDMSNFKARTENSILIMGRKTWDSIASSYRVTNNILHKTEPSLKKIFNFCNNRKGVYVLTTDESLLKNQHPTPQRYITSEQAKDIIDDSIVDVFIIGGISLFKHFSNPSEIYLSIIKEEYVHSYHNIINLDKSLSRVVYFPMEIILTKQFLKQNEDKEFSLYRWGQANEN